MLLSTAEQIKSHHSSGLWGDQRLDHIFARHVQDRADDLVFIDDQDLNNVTGRTPQCLSFNSAWRKVVALASFLTGIGMKSDTVVAMMLPPCADAAIFTLVASRLGLIIAPIPLTSGEAELRERLEQVGAKAIVCCPHYESESVAERARNVAADMFSIRFVFAIGDGAPEGLIELQSVLDAEDDVDEDTLFDETDVPPADAILSVHWNAASSQPARPIGRNHNQLLCLARQLSEQTGLEAGDCAFVTHHLSGLTGFAAGLVAAIDKAARLQFHHFETMEKYSALLGEFGAQHIMLPGSQWQALHQRLEMTVREQLKSVSLVWSRSHVGQTEVKENETAARLVDLTNFGDLALFGQIRRHPSEVGSVPLGSIESRETTGAAFMETYLFGIDESRALAEDNIVGGELCLKGAMVPECAFPKAGAVDGETLRSTPEGFVHTEIACHLVTEEHGDQRAMFRPLGDVGDILSMGALTERAEDLDALYRSCDGVEDAAAFVVPSKQAGPAQLMAALVVHDDHDKARHMFYHSLKARNVASTRLPRDVIFVAAIPRNTSGQVQRDSLLAVSNISDVA